MRRDERWPSVGVIIPNQARLTELAEAIASVEQQRYEGTVKVYLVHQPRPEIAELAARWPDLLVPIPHANDDTVSSIAARRNVGLDRSSEDLVAFLDDDDLWHPDKLRLQVGAMKEQGAVGCFSRWINFRSGTLGWRTQIEAAPTKVLGSYDFLRSGRTVTSSMLVDGDLARSLLMDDRSDWTGLDDYDFKLRLQKHGRLILLPQELTALRVDPFGGSRSQPALHFARAFAVFLAWARREGWSIATYRAFLVRWLVTATFPRGEIDPQAVDQLTAATSAALPGPLGNIVRWSIIRSWRSRRLIPVIRKLIPKELIE